LSRDSQTSEPNKFEQLARFKALSIAVTQEDQSQQGSAAEEIGMPAPVATCLEITRLQLTSINGQTHSKPQRTAGTYNSDTVWVEWKYYDVQSTTLAYPYIEHRISRLSILLKSPGKSDEFRLPSCIGYVHDPTSTRIGLVFASLIPASPSNPQSLYSRLQTWMKPSLSLRIGMAQKLATSLIYLHATNWLHKGLRSENVLFQSQSDANWGSLWLSGFDYARPAEPDEVTELPSENREHELYRHPDVQFDVPRDGRYGFHKQHDTYSLGVVLVEIGVWQPINQFLGISLNQRITRPAIRGVRRRLLEKRSLAVIDAEAEQMFADAVRLCLAAEVVSVPEDSEDGNTEAETGVGLRDRESLGKAVAILNSIVA
jgi:Protein tyrosine and serine/threonine kinase